MHKGRRKIIQDHAELARRLRRITNLLWHDKMTEDEKRRYYDLEEQAMEHQFKATISNKFTMIL